MNPFNLQKIMKDERFLRVCVFLVTFIVLFALSVNSVIPQKYDLKEGQISPVDITSPRDFIDENATKEKIQTAIANIPLQYSKNNDLQRDAINKAKQFFDIIKDLRLRDENVENKVEYIRANFNLKVDDEIISYFVKLDNTTFDEVCDLLVKGLTDLLNLEILQNDDESFENAFYYLKKRILESKLDFATKNNLLILSKNFIKPNMFIDVKKTNELQELVKKQVEPVYIRKNQVIVSKGQTITAQHIVLLNKAGVLKNNSKSDVGNYVSLILIIILTEFLVLVYLYKFKNKVYYDINKFTLVFLILCLNTTLIAATKNISLFVIPVAFMPIILTMIFDHELAFFIFSISFLMSAILTKFVVEVLLIYLIGGLLGVIFVHNLHERSNVMFGGVLIGFINSIIVLSFGLILGLEFTQIFINMSYTFAGGVFSAVLAIGIMPIFEQIFDVVTPIKLMELSNPNQPLLKKVLFEAPGTYHHSILVGNLAEAAAEKVGANSLLARVGAYYHDIGKIKRPYFFKENQITNDNPHDNLTPKLSAMIISSHVKDGIELAEQYKLPKVIKQIIEEHHGTTLIKYFYAVAKKNGEDIDAESFRYPGPKPRLKESAIVMLADCVEAAVRSLKNVTLRDIEDTVGKIIEEKINDGQLDESSLTLKDIMNIKNSFINVLQGIFHNRIEYPEITEEGERNGVYREQSE
ncbi:MAG: HDIG domain-containing protein [Caloramator sp.]|nr:HDIG domain-containing protein [Caloramator sp.]